MDPNNTYGYDNANRLSGLSVAAGANTVAGYSFTRDANGNITQTSATTPLDPAFTNATWPYTYNTTKNRLTSDFNYAYTYDTEGELTKATSNANTASVRSLTFDYEHRLTAIGNTVSSLGSAQYSYDGLGNRLVAVGSDGSALLFGVEWPVGGWRLSEVKSAPLSIYRSPPRRPRPPTPPRTWPRRSQWRPRP
jgi:YD repeat-containing protein